MNHVIAFVRLETTAFYPEPPIYRHQDVEEVRRSECSAAGPRGFASERTKSRSQLVTRDSNSHRRDTSTGSGRDALTISSHAAALGVRYGSRRDPQKMMRLGRFRATTDSVMYRKYRCNGRPESAIYVDGRNNLENIVALGSWQTPERPRVGAGKSDRTSHQNSCESVTWE